ncbi:MAG: S46 family peptidase, partial [Flavipsychrobacter sp.]
MKKLLLSLLAVAFMLPARADEGMWIPMLIGKNYDEMQRLGLKLSKEDLYSINHSSLKDAVVQFAGGCTAEMISDNGLLLTNHHCGYDAIAGLSTVEKNYLDNGFWAHSMSEELPAAGVTVLFLQRMEDVTDEVMKAVGNAKGEEYNKRFAEISKKIEEREAGKDKYTVANVKEFFNGNQVFLLVYKRYVDVRLVGTPPKSLGKFGGDTDNWMWPRHTADFSMFRVYAGKDNMPAPYAATNVPYKPKKFLPVSIK